MQILDHDELQVFIRLAFRPRNFWIGLYISENKKIVGWKVRKYYLTFLPMITVKFNVYSKRGD